MGGYLRNFPNNLSKSRPRMWFHLLHTIQHRASYSSIVNPDTNISKGAREVNNNPSMWPKNDNPKRAQISKLVPQLKGFKDTCDHVESFKHITWAYEPPIDVIKVATFGLALEDHFGV